ncbi:peptidoglycan-binding protein [[Phormidium] sp. ETS-05]|uniref:peptidoglycan-binding domain-containing protein n=1 Tax=[Phormidium] sp. ETS-05 TaxID=222819 RepID=UPI0018EECFB7|nr:peptidoglycan-binding protein [[Phormidium] sp. ETS-05]
MESLAYIHLVEAYEQPIEQSISLRVKLPKFSPKGLFAFVSCALTATSIGIAGPAFALLRPGDSGEAVAKLQYRLGELGYFQNSYTGYYGEATSEAVREFQRHNGLTDDGVVGDKTQSALDKIYPQPAPATTQPTVRLGSKGATVFRIQRQLSSLKYFNYQQMNGEFDEATEAAIKQFQADNELATDGVVGEKTHMALANLTGL